MMKRLASLTLAIALFAAAATVRAAEPPRSEHPRPDFQRDSWLCLNGTWQFEIDNNDDGTGRGLTSGKELAAKITVPFCPESSLSGIGNYDSSVFMKNVWYRRTFEVPAAMQGRRVLLHFGAVDYQAWVYVNGVELGTHVGGSAPFAFEVTGALKPGVNEVVVKVFDDTRSGLQPTGKQSHGKSEGCVYTRVTGIWQPVWLEGVGSTYIDNFSLVPDPEHSRALIQLSVSGPCDGLEAVAEAFAEGKSVGTASAPAQWRNGQLVLSLAEKKLWEPSSPFLYDLKLTLRRGGATVDEVKSYFGLRTVSIAGRAILINGKRVFQRLILDQGFYPDGIWTAPSDAALKHDIEMSMACGYNGARLHQKVFEPRFLYWADKLGYLVWGEWPNWGFNYKPEGYAPYVNEWTEVLRRDRNHPAIVGWCPFNETGDSAGELQQVIWNVTKAVDPTRPALETSGWAHTIPNPEVRDDHDYNQTPESFKTRWMAFFTGGPGAAAIEPPARYTKIEGAPAQGKAKGKGKAKAQAAPRKARPKPADIGIPFMVSEFGGTRWERGGQNKDGSWGYGKGPENMEEFYKRYDGLVSALLDNPYMFGFCYTQLTDVEQEHNGLYYYNRDAKFDAKRMHAITARQAAYEKDGPPATPVKARAAAAPADPAKMKVIIGAAQDGDLAKPYRYSTEKPAEGWTGETFNDGDWKSALAPFGAALPGVRTPWKTPEIFLRQTFEYGGGDVSAAALVIFHDEDTEVYVNGEKIWSGQGYVTTYKAFDVTEKLKKALKKGKNTLAVHTTQSAGGQYIDLALLVQ